jgi:pSer/pThr/pTyr-binding forkhead associated (FHA) protein
VVERPIPVTPTPIPTPIPSEPITLPLPSTENALAALGVAGAGVFVFGLLTVARRRKRRPVPAIPVVIEKVQDSAVMTGLETAVLERLNGNPNDAQQFNLDSETILIGRDMHIAQVVLNDKSVSRLHARIRRHPDGYWLYDEGSAMGTHLNFERLGLAPRRLKDQDRISIGQIQLKFILLSAMAED